jgi:hypothetical protein
MKKNKIPLSNPYEGQDATEIDQLARDTYSRIPKTFQFEDGN